MPGAHGIRDERRKTFLPSARSLFSRVREFAPYTIEHIDVPWNGTIVSGNLHLAPGGGTRPLIFYVPGCDQTKEAWPHPYYNQALQRGMHAFSFDGPGQGESNLRGIRLTADNYEEAAMQRSLSPHGPREFDPKRSAYPLSFAHIGAGLAASERRTHVCSAVGFVRRQYYLMTEESPRYKQLFAYLTRPRPKRIWSLCGYDYGRRMTITCPTRS